MDDVTNQRRLDIREFKGVLFRAGVKISEQQIPVLERLFDQMADRQVDITKAAMIRILGKEFSNVGHVKQAKSNEDLPEAPYCVNQFLYFLIHNYINVLVIFKEHIRAKAIPMQEFKRFLNKYHYRGGAPGDLELMIRFFTSGKDASKILLAKIVVYARKIDPTYGKDKGPQEHLTTRSSVTPHTIKRTLKKLSDTVRDRQMTKEQLFAKLDANNSGYIDCAELVKFCQDNNMLAGLTKSDIEEFYRHLDTSSDGRVSINELLSLIQGTQLSHDARMKSFSPEFEADLRREIEALFDKMRAGKGLAPHLGAEDLLQVVRTTSSGEDSGLDKARQMVIAIDKNNDGKVSKEEFVDYLMPLQKQKILDSEEVMEDLRRMFKEQTALDKS